MSGMTATMTTRVTTVRMMLPAEVTELMSEVGRPDMMFAKMMSDMPLPTPRCVMISPSHMIMRAPTTMVKTTRMSSRISGAPALARLTP